MIYKKYWSDYKNCGGGEREFTTTIPFHKKFTPVPNLKFEKQFFSLILKKINLKNCFPNFNFGTGGELRKLSSPSKFLWSILAAIDNHYCSGNWRFLFRRWSTIIVLAAIGNINFSGYRRLLFWRQSVIVITSTAIGDRYFGGDRRSLVKISPILMGEQ